MDKHDWQQITRKTAWCSMCGGLRKGTWIDEVYEDHDGDPLRLTSTGFYWPNGYWEDGAPPEVFLKDIYGEPYAYTHPEKPTYPEETP